MLQLLAVSSLRKVGDIDRQVCKTMIALSSASLVFHDARGCHESSKKIRFHSEFNGSELPYSSDVQN